MDLSSIPARRIVTLCAEFHMLPMKEFISNSKVYRLAHPRQRAMYAVRLLKPNLSYPMIAQFFDKRDHTTIIHGVNAVKQRMESDPEEKKLVEELIQFLIERTNQEKKAA